MPCRQLCNGPSQFPFHQRRARVSSNCSSIVAISLARLGVGARRSGRSTPMRARDIAPHVSYSPNDGAWNGPSDVSVCPVIPWDIQTPSGQQLKYLIRGGEEYRHLIESALQHRLEALPPPLPDDAGGGNQRWQADAGQAKSFEEELAAKLKVVRAVERQRTLEELILLMCADRLAQAGMVFAPSIQVSTNSDQSAWRGTLRECDGSLPAGSSLVTPQGLLRLLPPAVVDALMGVVASFIQGAQMHEEAYSYADRAETASLFAGALEYGSFVRGMQQRCEQAGVDLGTDCSSLVDLASQLSPEDLQQASMVQTREGWFAANRHIGTLFQLDLAEDLGFNPDALPFPAVTDSVQGIVIAPTAYLSEKYSAPGSADAARERAASKAARGWAGDEDMEVADLLPEADLVEYRGNAIMGQLLEAAALGCLIWEAESSLQSLGCQLTRRQAT